MIGGEQAALLMAIDPRIQDDKMAGGEHPIDGGGLDFISKSMEGSFIFLRTRT